jgi:hypothetical protein
MEFRLPANLQVELLAYDPKLKQLHRENNPTPTKAKSKFPLGAVFDLIPADIVNSTDVMTAVTNINARDVGHRYDLFDRVLDMGSVTERTTPHAIVYHYEKVWYSAWLPPKGQEDDYVYGYAYAYKNLDSVRKSVPYELNTNTAPVEYVKYGRSEFCVVRQNVTKEDIAEGNTRRWWVPTHLSYGKGQYIKTAINSFEAALSETIPRWEDQRGLFDRIANGNWPNILSIRASSCYWNTFSDPKQAMRDALPSAALFYELANTYKNGNTAEYYAYHEYHKAYSVMHIISKPFFRKWIQSQCDEAISTFENPENKFFRKVTEPWQRIQKLVESICYINSIWPDCPVDFYQTHIDCLIGMRLDRHVSNQVTKWLQTHMQPASFFHILSKNYKDQWNLNINNLNRYVSKDTGKETFYFSEWNDTLNMLDTVLEKNVEFNPPKRWRLTEFHDHVQTEAWKIKNPNVGLPQDLFPSPIKVEVGNERWSFFQPHDTHQLSAWGQAVRNCVGNSTNYAEGVRNKKHFIVLCMVDSKPQFTVQLKVEMGMMNVTQIAGTSNQQLTEDQKASYTEAFAQALQLQANALESV